MLYLEKTEHKGGGMFLLFREDEYKMYVKNGGELL